MKKPLHQHFFSLFPLAYGWIFLASIILISLAFLSYKYKSITTDLKNTKAEMSLRDIEAKDAIQTLQTEKKELTETLALAHGENSTLHTNLQIEQTRNNSYEEQIKSIAGTVGDLYKLSQTDKELLQKYSNVYFLNENYIPSALSDIDQAYLVRREKPEKIHTQVKPYLENLMKDASVNNIPLSILSAYRSFSTQTSLKFGYKIQYGTTAANKFSADQGYSEHQLGSTIDFTTPSNGEVLSGFEKSTAYAWLLQNAYKYGFTLSYPKGNNFYQFEPWHWRFVGVELATKLKEQNKYFYDFDQREINIYLLKIFN